MTSLGLLVLKTNQPEELVAFYTCLGLKFEKHQHGSRPIHYSANVDGVIFEIYPLPKSSARPDNTTRLGFKVNELDRLIEKIKNSGIKVIAEPQLYKWGYTAIIEDLDGRKVELTQKD